MAITDQLDLKSLSSSSLIAIIEELREQNKCLNANQLANSETLAVARRCLKVNFYTCCLTSIIYLIYLFDNLTLYS